MRKSRALVLPLSCAVALAAACAAKPPNPPMTPAAPADAGVATPDGGAAPVAAAAPDAAAGPVYPTFFTGDAGGAAPSASGSAKPQNPSGPPALGDAALDAAIDLATTALAPRVAPKMDKEGAPSHQTLKEGEHFGMVVTLQPGRCYTFVGFSPPGSIAQLDLKLYAMPLNIQAGTSSASDKAAPVMGKGTGAICPLLPVAVPYKLDAVATKGAGRMGVAVYSRSK